MELTNEAVFMESDMEIQKEQIGRICEVQKNSFVISYQDQELPAKLCGAFYKGDCDFPVVGDYVAFDYNPYGESRILTVCERKSILKRPDQAGHAMAYVKTIKEQVMVANFDYVFIVSSLNDNYNVNRIARYVTITLQGGGIPVVILTKADLVEAVEDYVEEIQAVSDKAEIHAICALDGTGLEQLKKYLVSGRTIALLGSSGVGKSTLLNALAGEEIMKTGAVREKDAKGRHTTTSRHLFTFSNGVTIIDTPGMRELGMCDVEQGIEDTFSDIAELECQCRFRDCQHKSEPGCAVKSALENGALSQERWELYQGLSNESRRSADMKAIAKARKVIKKNKR